MSVYQVYRKHIQKGSGESGLVIARVLDDPFARVEVTNMLLLANIGNDLLVALQSGKTPDEAINELKERFPEVCEWQTK